MFKLLQKRRRASTGRAWLTADDWASVPLKPGSNLHLFWFSQEESVDKVSAEDDVRWVTEISDLLSGLPKNWKSASFSFMCFRHTKRCFQDQASQEGAKFTRLPNLLPPQPSADAFCFYISSVRNRSPWQQEIRLIPWLNWCKLKKCQSYSIHSSAFRRVLAMTLLRRTWREMSYWWN